MTPLVETTEAVPPPAAPSQAPSTRPSVVTSKPSQLPASQPPASQPPVRQEPLKRTPPKQRKNLQHWEQKGPTQVTLQIYFL